MKVVRSPIWSGLESENLCVNCGEFQTILIDHLADYPDHYGRYTVTVNAVLNELCSD